MNPVLVPHPKAPVRKARSSSVTREEVFNATPVHLLNMLFSRLMLDLERGKIALEGRDYVEANNQLLHAQEILTELSSSLDTTSWNGARNLLAVYQWCEVSIARGNIYKNPKLIEDAIRQLRSIQDSWREAAISPEVAHMNRNA